MRTTKAICLLILTLLYSVNVFSNSYAKPKHYLPDKPVILNCGGNPTSVKFLLKTYPGSTIYAIDADPDIYSHLVKKTKHYNKVFAFHRILTSYDGKCSFYCNKDKHLYKNQGSIYKPNKQYFDQYWPDIRLEEKPIVLDCQTLDTFCKENKITKIDFLALDMQGSELGMLKKSQKILPTVKAIVTEVHYEDDYEGCPLYPEMKEFLESKGFVEVGHHQAHAVWGDACFVRKEYLLHN